MSPFTRSPAAAPLRMSHLNRKAACRAIAFEKYQGLGNNFILVCFPMCWTVFGGRDGPSARSRCTSCTCCHTPFHMMQVDNRNSDDPVVSSEEAKTWCDVNFGVGGDGIIFAMPPQGDTDFSMRIFNSDGSEPEMCGNGIRCLAKFVADADGVASASYRIHTLAGGSPLANLRTARDAAGHIQTRQGAQ